MKWHETSLLYLVKYHYWGEVLVSVKEVGVCCCVEKDLCVMVNVMGFSCAANHLLIDFDLD